MSTFYVGSIQRLVILFNVKNVGSGRCISKAKCSCKRGSTFTKTKQIRNYAKCM